MAVDLQYTLSKAGIDVGSQRMGKLMVQQSTENGYKNLGWGGEAKKIPRHSVEDVIWLEAGKIFGKIFTES